MKHSTVFSIVTWLSLALAIFSMWFFTIQAVTLMGLVLGTGFIVLATLSIVITNILIKEGK